VNDRRRIIALPGTLCSPRIFDRLIDEIDIAVEAISWMTMPGPWDLASLAARVAEQIRSGGGPAVVIGHSTGGAIALQLALDHPDVVTALVLLGTGQNMHGHGDVDAIIDAMEQSWGPDLFRAVLARSFAEPIDAAAAEELFLDYASRLDARPAIEVLRSQRATDFHEQLGRIAVPCVVLHGRHDPTRTVAQAHEFAADLGAPLHLLACGHSAMFELPQETAAILRPLLRS
jgi:pimeloyl-ACP methyl ester carboxylesterase